MVPNSLVVAFDKSVQFEPLAGLPPTADYSRPGTLVIPVDETLPEEKKPGWIVDGQQRAAAIRVADVKSFPICVTAFIAADDREQREQFILVNSTKPLPKSLIYELLPATDSCLPSHYQRRRFPAQLLARLNRDADSDLAGRIRTPTSETGVVKDNSILKMIENSLSDGVLYRLRGLPDGENEVEEMLRVLKSFWRAVKETFSDAWDKPPRRSRLMHGAGVVSLGFLMDAIADRYRSDGLPDVKRFRGDLEPLTEVCSWTNGYWDFGAGAQRKWDDIQNTSRDIELLTNFLLMQYKARVWNRALANRPQAR